MTVPNSNNIIKDTTVQKFVYGLMISQAQCVVVLLICSLVDCKYTCVAAYVVIHCSHKMNHKEARRLTDKYHLLEEEEIQLTLP